MKHTTLLIFLLVLSASFTCYAQRGAVTELSAKNVWNLKDETVWRVIHEKCGGGGDFEAWRISAKKLNIRQQRAKTKFVNCVALRMQKAGAPAQAIAFTKEMNGEVYMSSFREMGKVDLASIDTPLWNDPQVSEAVLVNGTTRVMYLWDKVENIDITKDPFYPTLARQFPEVTMFPLHGCDSMKKLPGGGQRFICGFVLFNGCRACDIAGSANFAFDFDATGKFLKARLVNLEKFVEKSEVTNTNETNETVKAVEFVVPLGKTVSGFNFSRRGALTYNGKPFSPAIVIDPKRIAEFKISLLPEQKIAGAIGVDQNGFNLLYFLDTTKMTQEENGESAAYQILWSPSKRFMIALCEYEGQSLVTWIQVVSAILEVVING